MDDWADIRSKEIAIGFADYTQKKYWEKQDDGLWYKWAFRTPKTNKQFLTTKQLYNQYLKTLQP